MQLKNAFVQEAMSCKQPITDESQQSNNTTWWVSWWPPWHPASRISAWWVVSLRSSSYCPTDRNILFSAPFSITSNFTWPDRWEPSLSALKMLKAFEIWRSLCGSKTGQFLALCCAVKASDPRAFTALGAECRKAEPRDDLLRKALVSRRTRNMIEEIHVEFMKIFLIR